MIGRSAKKGDKTPADAPGDAGGWGWWIHVLTPWLAGGGITVLVLSTGLAFAPGVPAGWRPQNVYRQWRYERLFEAGLAAERRGETGVAKVAFLAAAESRPGLAAPRVQLTRMLAEEGRFDEAMSEARAAGLDGPAFVHDVLLLGGRFEALLKHATRRLAAEPGREGVWLYSIRLAALALDPGRRDAAYAEAAAGAPEAPARRVADALVAAAGGRRDEVRAALEQRERAGALAPEEIMAGLDAWLDAGDPARALVWINRHRARLGPFDERLADYRIEEAADSALAPRLLESFGGLPLNENRWCRVAAAATARGLTENQFERLAALATKSGLSGSRRVSVALWAMAVAGGWAEKTETWAAFYRKSGAAVAPPVLAARKLRDPSREARLRATLLLVKESPFPRELLQTVFTASWAAENGGL